MTFASKPQLALQLVDRAQAWGVPFTTIVTDAGYGIPSFVQALVERGLPYVCAVACDFGVRLPHEMRQAQETPSCATSRRARDHRGPTRGRLADGGVAPGQPRPLAQATRGHPGSCGYGLCSP